MAKIFFSYSHVDEAMRDRLEKHLAVMKRNGKISTWHDRRIAAGDNFSEEIDKNLCEADLVLLLISADFLASDYCYTKEMNAALQRQADGQCRVVAIILKPCRWTGAPFAGSLALPTDGKPISAWPDPESGYTDVASGIETLLSEMGARSSVQSPRAASVERTAVAPVAQVPHPPRSSNLRVRKQFTDQDKAAYLKEGYEFLIRFFRGSIEELEKRHSEISGDVDVVPNSHFVACLYRDGKQLSVATIRLARESDWGGRAITYSQGDDRGGRSFNESLSVEANERELFFKPLGMQTFGRESEELGTEGASELYWSLFIEPLQR